MHLRYAGLLLCACGAEINLLKFMFDYFDINQVTARLLYI
jgi:hypothetical protein